MPSNKLFINSNVFIIPDCFWSTWTLLQRTGWCPRLWQLPVYYPEPHKRSGRGRRNAVCSLATRCRGILRTCQDQIPDRSLFLRTMAATSCLSVETLSSRCSEKSFSRRLCSSRNSLSPNRSESSCRQIPHMNSFTPKIMKILRLHFNPISSCWSQFCSWWLKPHMWSLMLQTRGFLRLACVCAAAAALPGLRSCCGRKPLENVQTLHHSWVVWAGHAPPHLTHRWNRRWERQM